MNEPLISFFDTKRHSHIIPTVKYDRLLSTQRNSDISSNYIVNVDKKSDKIDCTKKYLSSKDLQKL